MATGSGAIRWDEDPLVKVWLAELDRVVQESKEPARPQHWYRPAIAATATTALAVGIIFSINRPTPYSTGIGDQRNVVLADGSRMILNTASKAVVRITKDERSVKLLRGEAVSAVIHDVTRPFDVVAGRSVVRAIGTRFNVEILRNTANVAILEGVVQIRNNTPGSAAVEIPAVTHGQTASLDGSKAISSVSRTELRRIAAWQNRKLEFEDLDLAAAISEYNRYSAHPFIIGAAAIDSVKFSGVFRIGDVAAFRYALEHSLGLHVVDTLEGHVVSRP